MQRLQCMLSARQTRHIDELAYCSIVWRGFDPLQCIVGTRCQRESAVRWRSGFCSSNKKKNGSAAAAGAITSCGRGSAVRFYDSLTGAIITAAVESRGTTQGSCCSERIGTEKCAAKERKRRQRRVGEHEKRIQQGQWRKSDESTFCNEWIKSCVEGARRNSNSVSARLCSVGQDSGARQGHSFVSFLFQSLIDCLFASLRLNTLGIVGPLGQGEFGRRGALLIEGESRELARERQAQLNWKSPQ